MAEFDGELRVRYTPATQPGVVTVVSTENREMAEAARDAAQAARDQALAAAGVFVAPADEVIAGLVGDEGSATRQALDEVAGGVTAQFDVWAFGAVGDGAADDTAAVQAAVDAAAVTGGLVAAHGGTFAVTKILLRSRVTLDLTGSTLRARVGTVTGVIESPGWAGSGHIDDAAVIGGVVDANNLTNGGIYVKDANRVTVQGVRFINMKPTSTTSIRLDEDTADCRILNNVIEMVLDQPYGTVPSGVGISACSRTVDDQSGGQNNNLTFTEPTNLSQRHVISGNRIYGGTHGIALVGGQSCTISNNIIEGQGHRCIILSPRACDNTITGNILKDFNSTGIHMAWGCLRNTITGNTLRTTKSGNEGDGIKGYFGCSDNVVSGNFIQGVTGSATGAAIRFAVGSAGNVIADNRINGCLTGVRIDSKLAAPYYQPTTPPHTTGTMITGNLIVAGGLANSCGIRLAELGGIQIRRVTLMGNNVVTAALGLEILEPTTFSVNSLTATANSFDATTKSVLPRGAGHFLSMFGNEGMIEVTRGPYVQMSEASEPGNAAGNDAYLFLKDNGAGKTQLCVRFSSGVTQVIATQP